MKKYQTSTHQTKEKTTKKKRSLPEAPLAAASAKKVPKKTAVPEPSKPPPWTTKVLPSATACSSTTAPAEEGRPVTESDLEKLTKLLEASVVKEELPEAEGKEAGYWNGIWAEKDDWQPGLWWLFYPGFGWTRWRDTKVTWPIKHFFPLDYQSQFSVSSQTLCDLKKKCTKSSIVFIAGL